MIDLVYGNILIPENRVVVNPVNCKGAMGKGVAFAFKQRFPKNYLAYKNACDAKAVAIGRMFVFEEDDRLIINFPTKEWWSAPSQYSYIRLGLIDLIRVVREHNIDAIAIPALGCGEGRLDFNQVIVMVGLAFNPLPDVSVLLYRPYATLTKRLPHA